MLLDCYYTFSSIGCAADPFLVICAQGHIFYSYAICLCRYKTIYFCIGKRLRMLVPVQCHVVFKTQAGWAVMSPDEQETTQGNVLLVP